jgi:hypothetical protein
VSDRVRRLFQTSIPIEHIVDVKTTSTEEEQIQPTVNVIEAQPEKEEDQVLKTTTEVEQQPQPQFSADASSTQPNTVEEVSENDPICAVSLCAVMMIERTFFASLPFQYRHC